MERWIEDEIASSMYYIDKYIKILFSLSKERAPSLLCSEDGDERTLPRNAHLAKNEEEMKLLLDWLDA